MIFQDSLAPVPVLVLRSFVMSKVLNVLADLLTLPIYSKATAKPCGRQRKGEEGSHPTIEASQRLTVFP
jgi:hypothetical protein